MPNNLRHGKVHEDYVSEFTSFMTHFLEEHPEVIADQKAGRSIYWDRKANPVEQEKAAKDQVPDNHYGFSYPIGPGRGRKRP